MRTVYEPYISEKREQTYNEAMEAIVLPRKTSINRLNRNEMFDHTVYLRDIAKRLYTEGLILAALKHHRCRRFDEIPDNLQSETVYLTALECYTDVDFIESVITAVPCKERSQQLSLAALKNGGPYVMKYIPTEYFKRYEFAVMAVSLCPRAVESVLSLYRSGREITAFNSQDLRIIAEAMCPRAAGKNGFDKLLNRKESADAVLKGRTFDQFCSEEYGYLPQKLQFVVHQELVRSIKTEMRKGGDGT